MRRVIKTLGWTVFAALLLGIAAVVGAVAVLGSLGSLGSLVPFDDTVIRIDDTTLTLSQLGLGDWLVMAAGIGVGLMVAFIVLVVVVPLAVLLPLAIVALVLGAVVMILAGAAALVCSPLILFVAAIWLVWRLARGPAHARVAARPVGDVRREPGRGPSAGAGPGGSDATMAR